VRQGGRNGLFAAGVVVLTLLTAQPHARAADDEAAVTYRKHVMRTMGEQAAALGMILQKNGPQENAVFHARTIALAADSALNAFEPKVSGGEAKDEIWRNWTEFTARLKLLSASATDLAAVGERDGLVAMQSKAMDVLKNCKSCHDIYTLRQGR
jgi:cytochrome c556